MDADQVLVSQNSLIGESEANRSRLYMADGIYQSLICFFMGYLLFASGGFVTQGGQQVNDRERIGVYIACATIIALHIYLLMNTYRWDWLLIVLAVISSLLIFFWTGVYTSFPSSIQFYKAAAEVFGTLAFWALTLLTVAICMIPRFSIKAAQKIFFPRDIDIIREQVRKGEWSHLEKYEAYVPPAKTASPASSDILQPTRPPHRANTDMEEDQRPIYPPSVAATGTTHNPRSQTGSDGTDYTGHQRLSIERPNRLSLERPSRPSIDHRPRPSFDRMRESMDRIRPSFEASNEFTSAALLTRVESSHSDIPQRRARSQGPSGLRNE